MEITLETVERVARDSYGRLLAFLTARTHDLASSEDALAEAFRTAIEVWPRAGVPDTPEAWLLVVARRRLLDDAKHVRVGRELEPVLREAAKAAQQVASTDMEFPDERLQLLFLCAHPAIDPAVRTPLMLQAIMGLDAARIASAFLVRPSTMGQRLSRAKAKIRDARIRFELPEWKDIPARLEFVLEAIYAAYGSGWDDLAGADERRKGLAQEAIELGRLLARLLPQAPETHGLLALMLYCESRRRARRSASHSYVPLADQDVTQWSQLMIMEAEHCLAVAARGRQIGRFQLEAAIQSAHAHRAVTGRTDWEAIALMYEGLLRLAPTYGAMVSHAAAVAETRGAAAGWALLESIPSASMRDYQPYWALTAHLHKRLRQTEKAAQAYGRAIGLCEDAAVREFLLKQMKS